MSIVICDDCEAYIDTDIDADCFVENYYRQGDVVVLCEIILAFVPAMMFWSGMDEEIDADEDTKQ